MKTRFSIVVPVYNVHPWLAECLDSVLRQMVSDWECICVDDGSTDESGHILDEYARRDCRFVVIHQHNMGVSAARNAALDRAMGEWIVYLDGDDFLSDQALAIFIRGMELAPDAGLLQYEIVPVGENDKKCSFQKDLKHVHPMVSNDPASVAASYLGASFCTYAYRRDRCGQCRFSNYTMGEDRLYLAECAVLARSKIFLREVGYCCRQRVGSAMRSAMTLRKFADIVHSRRDIVSLISRTGIVLHSDAARMTIQSLVEMSPPELARIPLAERHEAWDVYFDTIDSVPRAMITTLWQKSVCRLLSCTRSRILGVVFCVWPHRLKLWYYRKGRS